VEGAVFSHVLVPLDESEYSERALTYAREATQAAEARVTLLTVLLRPDSPGIPHIEKLDRQSEARALAYLDSAAEKLRAAGATSVETKVMFGDAAGCIVDAATSSDVDLIAMSTHGLGASGRYALGSVALKVLMTAPCPVLMVRIDELGAAPPGATRS
jgi:nucleotide-binding universal stress UspA family protein